MKCRHCTAPLKLSLVDLGSAPPSNAYLVDATLSAPEKWFPLRVMVCDRCWLVQTEDFAAFDELFGSDYAYLSSISTSWLAHAKSYVEAMTVRFGLTSVSHVIEVAANDGYLLQYFQKAGIPNTGVEPTASTAQAARDRGIDIVERFFTEALGRELAASGRPADLTVANNVLAHVPDINDFVRGFAAVLKPGGVATFEFPWLLHLLQQTQFDTIYHEHFSYLSLLTASRVFEANGLRVFDVEELTTHGGSLRVFAQRSDRGTRPITAAVGTVLERETVAGLAEVDVYEGFQQASNRVKNDFLNFLLQVNGRGETVVGYGAAAKGNTLLNYAGVRPDLLRFVVDRSPTKAGKYLPGSRIPIVSECRLCEARPDYVVILPWNLRDEIVEQLSYAREWGARFVTAVPQLEIMS